MFTKLPSNDLRLFAYIRRKISLFVVRFYRLSTNLGKKAMQIEYIDICSFMTHLQLIEVDKQSYGEEFRNQKVDI